MEFIEFKGKGYATEAGARRVLAKVMVWSFENSKCFVAAEPLKVAYWESPRTHYYPVIILGAKDTHYARDLAARGIYVTN